MARLTEGEVAQLVTRLTRETPEPAVARDDDERFREQLADLGSRGDLGPPIGHKLAAYLNQPVRCTSGRRSESSADQIVFAASTGPGFWISIDTLLAAAVADVMIGGDGDPARIGVGAKTTRVSIGAATEMIGALAAAIGAPAPGGVEPVTEARALGSALSGGSITIGTNEFGWSAGLRGPADIPSSRHAALGPTARHAPLPRPVAPQGPQHSVEAALEAARKACSHAFATPVVFGAARSERRTPSAVPPGCINVGVPAPPGTAVLSVDERTASSFLAVLTHGAVHDAKLDTLARSGVETIATDALQAFVDALAGPVSSSRHALALSDAAILAAIPHDAIGHEVAIAGHTGSFRWLVPSDLTRAGA